MPETTPVVERPDGPSAHDQVAMLSLAPDLSPRQVDPEIIGDTESAKKGLTIQLHQNSVSAADGGNEPVAVEDAEALLETAKSAAESVVEDLKTKVETVGVAAANEAKGSSVTTVTPAASKAPGE